MNDECVNCGIEVSPFLTTKDHNRRRSEETFHYVRCSSCGLIQLTNVPTNLSEYYSATYYDIPKDREDLLRNAHLANHKVDFIRQFKEGGRLLEVGSAYGLFACLAKRAGYDVQVIEMDGRCCEFVEGAL